MSPKAAHQCQRPLLSAAILSVLLACLTPGHSRLVNPFIPPAAARPVLWPGNPVQQPAYTGCRTPPAVQQDLYGVYWYTDDAASQINDTAHAQDQDQLQPMTDFANGLSALSAAYWGGGRSPPTLAAAQCALSAWLRPWAAGNGMLGQTNTQGRLTRKFRVVQIAVAYLRIRSEPSLSPADMAVAEAWLRRLGYQVKLEYSTGAGALIKHNHVYWAGLAAALCGIAIDDVSLFAWGLGRYTSVFVPQLTQAGYLPQELSRGGRALFYHMFSAEALTLLAWVAQANGVDLYSQGGYALSRLTCNIIIGLGNTAPMAAAAGNIAQVPINTNCTCNPDCDISFLEIFLHVASPTRDIAVYQAASSAMAAVRPASRSITGGFSSYTFFNVTFTPISSPPPPTPRPPSARGPPLPPPTSTSRPPPAAGPPSAAPPPRPPPTSTPPPPPTSPPPRPRPPTRPPPPPPPPPFPEYSSASDESAGLSFSPRSPPPPPPPPFPDNNIGEGGTGAYDSPPPLSTSPLTPPSPFLLSSPPLPKPLPPPPSSPPSPSLPRPSPSPPPPPPTPLPPRALPPPQHAPIPPPRPSPPFPHPPLSIKPFPAPSPQPSPSPPRPAPPNPPRPPPLSYPVPAPRLTPLPPPLPSNKPPPPLRPSPPPRPPTRMPPPPQFARPPPPPPPPPFPDT